MIPELGWAQLLWCLVFVALAAGANLWLGLGLGRELWVGSLRAVAQLFLMGYALVYIFHLRWAWLTLAVFLGMVTAAALIVRGRVRRQGPPVFLPVLLSMALGYLVITYLVVGVALGVEPWWEPRFWLPLGGMVAGNSMNGVSLALERLFSEARAQRPRIETLLVLGATPAEASAPLLATAVRAGMIPSLNALTGVGVVFLPGMMTGQILAGADPITGIKYQILVMFMLVGSAAVGVVAAAWLARRRLFTAAWQLAPLAGEARNS